MTFVEGLALGILSTLFIIIAMDWIPEGNKQSNDEIMSIDDIKKELEMREKEYKEMSIQERLTCLGHARLRVIKRLRGIIIIKEYEMKNAK